MCGMNKKSNDKNIIISFSLLMRLFEFMHEDAENDVDMHKVMEKLVAFSDGVNPLTMDVYDCLVADVKPQETSEYASDEDLQMSYDLGQEYAENGVKLSLDGRDYSTVAGEIISDERDSGYGASNSELEQFWNGYCKLNPDCIFSCGEQNVEQPTESEYDNEIEQIIQLGRM